ncbi:phage tail protein, partial [Reichenbachiella versicolor]|uniref:phage tail protein n=1 Tax=Reichenbachiella versicolor TaxID=1821036 RepID=UPI001C8868D4
DINEKLDKLQQQTVAKEKALKEKMAKLRAQAIAAVDKKIEERKAKMKGAMSKFGGLVLDLAMKFFTFTLTAAGMDPAPVMAMINKGVVTLTEVITKPMRFFTNLGSAVNNGITGFQTNFKKHIMGGMVQWLTGAVGGIIEIPQTFDLRGIMKMGFSALGLTWMNLRQRIVKHVGEPVMGAAEKGFEVVTMIKKDGVSGLWEHLQAEAESVKQMAIDGIKNWALMTIVKEAVIKIALMLNPAGAIVEAIKSIYKLVMWIVDNTQRIITFITSVVNSVSSIAAGKISAAAGFIENAMATTIPMILSGLASFLGLGGIAKKIKEIISKVSAPINKAIDRGVGFVAKKAKAWFGKSKGGKKKVSKDKVDNQAKKEEKKSKLKLKGEKFSMAGSGHTLTFENKKIIMASIRGELMGKLRSAIKQIKANPKAKNLNGKADIVKRQAVRLLKVTQVTTKKIDDVSNSKDQAKRNQAQVALSKLGRLIGKFGDDYGLKDLMGIGKGDEKNKVLAQILRGSSILQPSEKVEIAEEREGNQIIGYSAVSSKTSKVSGGITVSELGGNKYTKKVEKEKNALDEYKKLKPLTPADRRKHIGSTEAHKEFEVDPISIRTIKGAASDKKEILYYKYKGGNQEFNVVYDKETGLPEKITGSHLTLHDFGAGVIQGETYDLHNRAHALANMLGGTGYKSGKNIVYTSKSYNQKEMKAREDMIAGKLAEINGLESFKMQVKIEYATPDNDVSMRFVQLAMHKRITQLKNKDRGKGSQHEYETLLNLSKYSKDNLKSLIEKNAKKMGQARCMKVEYEVLSVVANGKPMKTDISAEVGKDLLYALSEKI